jgi:hypothetical protein
MRYIIPILIGICLILFFYCNGKDEEKYKEIIKFSTQGGPVKDNYYVLTDNDNDDIIRGNQYSLNSNKRDMVLRHRRKTKHLISPKLSDVGIPIKPYGYYNEVPDINEYIHSFDYDTGHKVLDGFDIHNTRGMNNIDTSDLNIINVNDFYKPYDFHYRPVVNSMTYPIRDSKVELRNGMITSEYPNICARYGSSVLPDDINGYFKSTWCSIGVLINNKIASPYSVLNLYAQFINGSLPWRYRVYNKATSSYVFLPEGTRGSGVYQCLRDGDIVNNIPGFPGDYVVQIQKESTFVFESV